MKLISAIDEDEFRAVLEAELGSAWQTLRRRYPDAHFYSFGVYTTDLAEYLYVHAATEEGLIQVAREYTQRTDGDIELHKSALRWSPCDSPLHVEGYDMLLRSQAMRDAGPDPYEESEASDEAVALVFRSIVSVLQGLDRVGMFSNRDGRGRPMLSIWKGDQADEERIAFAELMNERSLVERFRRDVDAGNDAFALLGRRSLEK